MLGGVADEVGARLGEPQRIGVDGRRRVGARADRDAVGGDRPRRADRYAVGGDRRTCADRDEHGGHLRTRADRDGVAGYRRRQVRAPARRRAGGRELARVVGDDEGRLHAQRRAVTRGERSPRRREDLDELDQVDELAPSFGSPPGGRGREIVQGAARARQLELDCSQAHRLAT